MEKPVSPDFRNNALAIFARAVEDCSPSRLIASHFDFGNDTLAGKSFRLKFAPGRKMHIVALGKAARPMACALLDIIGEDRVRGVAVVPAGSPPAPAPIRTLHGNHPIPGAHSFRAGAAVLKSMGEVKAGNAVVHLISGGASAMVAAPLRGLLSTREKALLHRLLIESGLEIRDINIVRKHFSSIKGGRLAARMPGSRQVTILLSDVPAESPDAVGAGPTLPDPSSWEDCMAILESSGILPALPAALRLRLKKRRWPETLKPSASLFAGHSLEVLADASTLAAAAAKQARRLGFETHVLSAAVEDSPDVFLDRLFEERARRLPASRPRCWVATGEVRLRPQGKGRGGRAQDLALAAALRLAGERDALFFAAGSDGMDGNSPAAGAMSDGSTVKRARRLGLNPLRIRKAANSYELFRRLKDCVVTGPTGNNLRDLYMLLENPTRFPRP